MSKRIHEDTQAPRQILALNLRRLRTSAGLSQEELAFRAGLHRTYISAVERARRNVSLDNLFRLASGLQVNARDLLNPNSDGDQ